MPLILVVDDNADMNAYVSETLSKDYRVINAFDGETALAMTLDRNPDLVVCDVMMPVLSGDQYVRAVRSRPELSSTPIVILTAKSDDETRVQLLRDGANDYLTKPFSAEELRTRVGNLIRVQQAEHARICAIEDLKVSNEDLQRFAYVASHDLQAPLRAVGGFTELLMASLDHSNLDDNQQLMAQHIELGVTQMQRLIKDLLAFSRVETTQGEWQVVDVSAMHAEVTELLANQIAALDAHVTCVATDSVYANPTQLRAVLQNLIQNALVHRNPSRAPQVLTSSRDLGDGWIEIAVTDNGLGIPIKDHEKIFEVFKQLRKAEGSGIGLSIVKRIVERSGGAVSVESDGESGSTFSVTMKATPEDIRIPRR